MNAHNDTVTVTIDNRPLTVPRGATILKAAEANDIYIPTLCAHKDLTPFGGCRMCIVEVEGMRGFPTACTTPVSDGMIVRTHTAQVQSVRTEILRLILSEHPCSCLVCDEQEECRGYMGTIRKVGVTTGCRFCPNDGQCELEEVVRQMEITDIGYPIYYRGLPVHKDDPFFDRDYNLCILCGRCVRMCQEIRAAGTLTFKRRGPHTVVGPAFERTHLEAGCEFCGACVSVCPTGALSEKTRKWKGVADYEVTTTCSFCGVGCQMRLQVKNGEVIGSLPAEDDLVNRGQLCVKGRFCVPETVGHHRRLRRPYKFRDGALVDSTWEEAVEIASQRLSACPPKKFGMLISPNCTNEDLYIAQKFTRLVMGSHHIDTSARLFYGAGYYPYLDLLSQPATLDDVREATAILCIGLDTRFGRSVVGAELRQAMRRGARVVSIHSRPHDLTLIAETWLQPPVGTEYSVLEDLAALTSGKKPGHAKRKGDSKTDDLAQAAEILTHSDRVVILLGSGLLGGPDSPRVLAAVTALSQSLHAGIMPLPAFNNLLGAVLMGSSGEWLPGGKLAGDRHRRDTVAAKWGCSLASVSTSWNADTLAAGHDLDVLYLIGEVMPEARPAAKFIIYQNIYPPENTVAADLVLPAAAFVEVDGSAVNGEGRVQRLRKAVDPPGEALPDWEILSRIARKMGKTGFDFASAVDVHAEISSLVEGFWPFDVPSREAHHWDIDIPAVPPAPTPAAKKPTNGYPYMLTAARLEHTYRGFPLAAWVPGLRRLYPTDVLEIHPDDAAHLGVASGDEVVVASTSFEKRWPVQVSSNQPPGTVQVLLSREEFDGPNPHRVKIRRYHVSSR